MTTLIETLIPDVPPLLARHHAADRTPPSSPTEERFPAAILFADISGFTPLTRRLAERGPAGAEQLSVLINDYFARLVDILTVHGGQVLAFAGDAAIVAWPGLDTDESLPVLTLRAAQCGLDLMAALNGYAVAPDLGLSLKAGLGAGEVWAGTVGGVRGRWNLIVGGDPLRQMADAEEQAGRGEVILSPPAWTLVADRCTAQPRGEGYWRLLGVRRPVSPRAMEPVQVPPAAAAALRAYLPPAALERVEAGQMAWLASLRRVTMLFASVRGLDYAAPDVLARMQAATCAVQEAIDAQEGSLNQIVVDDKGTVVVAGWGLPGHTHEDDGPRAVRAGLALQARLQELGLHSSVGITTGRAFCGYRGSERRREYAVMGDTANLASRLMVAGAADAALCDEATYHLAEERLAFNPMPPLIVPGQQAPQPLFRARGERREPGGLRNLEVVGRRAEKAMLVERLRALREERAEQEPAEDRGEVRVVVIEGEPGIGKSCLVLDLVAQARQLGIQILAGSGDAVEQATPYFAWRSVFSGLFGLDRDLPAMGDEREQLVARLQVEPEVDGVAPLLNAVLALNLPDNDLTAEMSGEVRAGNTVDLLVRLLADITSRRRGDEPDGERPATLIVLEDAHWLDSASWSLARRASRDVPAVLIVVVMRPMGESAPEDYVELVRDSRTLVVRLNPLASEDVAELLRQRLGASAIAPAVVAFVHNRSEGNPFFAEELAHALRDADLIAIEEDACRFVAGIEDLTSLLPGTIEDVIMARIDQLPPEHQLTLKVASVIGRLFAFRTLRDVHPIEADRPNLLEHVNYLDQLDITPLQAPEPDLAYIFKHAITQEVTYNLMLFAQRRELHRAVARWYEKTYAADLSPHLALLAYHWERAMGSEAAGPDPASKALHYLEKSGDQALHNFANSEAARFFAQALALAPRSGVAVEHRRRAHWEMGLGTAHANLGRHRDARAHLEGALGLLDQPVPGAAGSLVLHLLGQVVRQVAHRAWPARAVGCRVGQRETLLAAFRAYEKLTEVYFFAGQALPSMHAAFRALNLAEAAGPSPELARGSASIGALVGFIPLHGAAQAYLHRALDGLRAFDHLPSREYVTMTAGFYYAGVGNWTESINLFDQLLAMAQRTGDHRHWDGAMSNLAPIHCYRAEFVSGAGLAAALHAASFDMQCKAHGLQWQAKCLFYLGRFDEVAAMLAELEVALGEDSAIVDQAMKIGVQGLRAATLLRRGAHDQALEAARQTMLMAARALPSSYGALTGYANPAEVCLALWEAGYPEPELPNLARRACKLARGFARIFTIGRPRALLWDGLHAWLAGKPARAHKVWQASLAAAEGLAMPYDEGLAHYEIGRHLPAGDPARQDHLARACDTFERLGAAFDLARVQAALAASQG